MFERRLRIVLLIPIFWGIVIVARLFHIQVVSGSHYEEEAQKALVAPRQLLPPLRGRIIDRFGTVLVSDEPALDVNVHYGALIEDEEYLDWLAGRIRRDDPDWREADPVALAGEVRRRISHMWQVLSAASGKSLVDLDRRRDAICQSVESLRHYIWNARTRAGHTILLKNLRLREEDLMHAILRDVTDRVRTQIELELSGYPFVRVEPSVRRVWSDRATSVCHLIGAVGQVTADRMENDPLKDDALSSYRLGDDAGVSGIELLGERILRGRRGFEEKNLDGERIQLEPPIDGRDVALTIDVDLQQQIATMLMQAVDEDSSRTGASCVVIDVATREVIAMVSVPTYTREHYRTRYAELRDDTRYRPLLFRAVMEEYQPGSILKPAALLAGFRHGVIDTSRTVHCDGSFIEGSKNWHCWTHWKHLPGHGSVCADEAISHSCNVYFYDLGQRLNAQRLTASYCDFIDGPPYDPTRRAGTGLIEERKGIIPTLEWITRNRNRSFRPADGRNYAIGQGELQITPLQAANLYATLAAGAYRDPTILADDDAHRPVLPIAGVTLEAWSAARRGLYKCVNEPGGTAYKHAYMEELTVCGKTGSAQCVARVLRRRYTFDLGGGLTQSALAPTIESAREALGLSGDVRCIQQKIVERWPPDRPDDDEPPTHAWFAAFAPYERPKIALAVIIEYGGGGGQAAGPIGRDILRLLMNSPHGYLTNTALTRDDRP